MHIFPHRAVIRDDFSVETLEMLWKKRRQMKIDNRVNEKRNFHGRMNETLHGNVFLFDAWSERSLKFPSSCMSLEFV